MTHFYEQAFRLKQLGKDEALQQAQLSLIREDHGPKGKDYGHPHFWAPFVLGRNWLPFN